MKEGLYNKDKQDSFNVAENDYFATIRHDKDLVWDRIEERLGKKKVIPFWYYSIAASLFLLLSLGFIIWQQLKEKNGQIEKLQAQLYNHKNQLAPAEIQKNKSEKQTDTLRIESEKIIYRNVIISDTIIWHDTITNIVQETDTVYIQKNEALLIAEIEGNKGSNEVQNQKNVVNQPVNLKKKNRRFIFIFGRNDNEIIAPETTSREESGLITLRSK